jgi:acetyl-CoA carboxylase biotin carboxyl carrier protein
LLKRKGAAMAQWDEQIDKLKQIIEIMKTHNLVEVRIKQGEDEVSVKKDQGQIMGVPTAGAGMPAVQAVPAPAAAPAEKPAEPAQQEKLAEIKSPLVGTFYAQSSPDSEPYVEVGSQVEADTVVCIIEAMKVMNEIKAETAGTIAEIVATNGEAVEYGRVLFRIRPD